MIALQADCVLVIISDGLASDGERFQIPARVGIYSLNTLVDLIALTLTIPILRPHYVGEDLLELPAGDLVLMQNIIEWEDAPNATEGDDGTKFRLPDRSAANEHDIHTSPFGEDVREQIP